MARLGLRRRDGPPIHLLSTFGNLLAEVDQTPEMTRRRASPGINDAPLSSDEESLPHESVQDIPQQTLSSGSGGEFKRARHDPSSCGPDSSARRSARTSSGQAASFKSSDNDQQGRSEDEQVEDEFDFLSSQSAKRVKRANCYGGRNIHASGFGARNRGGRALAAQRGALSDTKRNSGRFRTPPSEQEVDEKFSSSPPKPEFKLFEDHLDEPRVSAESGGTGLRAPRDSIDDAAQASSRSTRQNQHRGARRSARFRDEHVDEKPWRNLGTLDDDTGEPSAGKKTASSAVSSSAPSAGLSLSAASDDSSLSSPPDSPVTSSAKGYVLSRLEPSEFETRCPMCRAVVEQNLLEGFSGGRRLTVREQARFCRLHKTTAAEAEWTTKGYPQIDWAALPQRFEQFYPRLMDVVSNRAGSYYRDALRSKIGTGKNRTMQQDILTDGFAALTPGYYGSRGAEIMSHAILQRFSDDIRQRASSDRVIASSSVPEFVEAVLVPELAVLLVKQDMAVSDDETARNILRESVEMGDLLNEEDDGGGTAAAAAAET